MKQLYARFRQFVLLQWVAIPIMLIGLFGSVAGFIYWYGPSFGQYPVWQWPFVPDCPLFAFLFVPALTLILLNRSVPWFNALVALGLIKYGLWTDTYWVAYWINTGGHFTVEGITMAVSHFGMILEGLFLLSFLDMNWPTALLCGLWFGLCDWMDYGPFLTYPTIDIRTVPLSLMQWHTITVTVGMTALYAALAWKKEKSVGRLA